MSLRVRDVRQAALKVAEAAGGAWWPGEDVPDDSDSACHLDAAHDAGLILWADEIKEPIHWRA